MPPTLAEIDAAIAKQWQFIRRFATDAVAALAAQHLDPAAILPAGARSTDHSLEWNWRRQD
jgi:hypothetical protein